MKGGINDAEPHPGGYTVLVDRMVAGERVPPAVRGLSLHVPRGSIYGLAGPRGAGKTTVMRVLATLIPPIRGTVLVDGMDVQRSLRAVRTRIGYLPDSSGMYDYLTVSEYMNFYAGIFGLPSGRRKRVIDELLQLVDLHDQHATPVRRLSRSMRQQLRLARCLVHDPSVLLLDEPAAGLDPEARLDLRDILQELARLGKTVLISSNLLSELEEVCTHLGIIRRGEMLVEGEVAEVMEAVLPHPRLRVTLAGRGDLEVAMRVLEAHPASTDVRAEGGTVLIATYTGQGGDLQTILSDLVGAAAGVREFALNRPQLEDVYLRVLDAEASA